MHKVCYVIKIIQMICQKSIKNFPNAPYLDWIKSGEKQYEGRLKSKINEWNLRVGRCIKFFDKDNTDSWVFSEIISLQTYTDFGTAFDTLGSKLIPGKTRDEVVKLYNSLYHYHNENIDELANSPSKMITDNGVVIIGLRVITMRPLY